MTSIELLSLFCGGILCYVSCAHACLNAVPKFAPPGVDQIREKVASAQECGAQRSVCVCHWGNNWGSESLAYVLSENCDPIRHCGTLLESSTVWSNALGGSAASHVRVLIWICTVDRWFYNTVGLAVHFTPSTILKGLENRQDMNAFDSRAGMISPTSHQYVAASLRPV